MPPKQTKKKRNGSSMTPMKGTPAVQVGVGAALVGFLTWLTGGWSWQNAMEWTKALLVAGGLALIIRWTLGEPFRIPSGSMEPTLHGDPRFLRGDRVFVNKFVYGLRWPLNDSGIVFTNKVMHYAKHRIWRGAGPQRFDIIVFKSIEKDADHRTLVKRIIGLPGEHIHIADGKVYVNGEPLTLPPSMPDVYYTSPPYADMKYGVLESPTYSVVPPDHYLFLGDNSAHSRDGRFWGWVPNENILGRVSCIWWPIPRWRDFSGFSTTWWWRAIVALVSLLVFVRLFLGRSWRVQRQPAAPDLAPASGERLYINRAAFGLPIPFTRRRFFHGRPPRRGELVLYYAPRTDEGDQELELGRVVGLPGERLYLDGAKLFVNDAPLIEPPSLAGRTFPPSANPGPFGMSKSKQYSLVPEGRYYLLSDDDETPDSRSLGWITQDSLVGPASAVWWPPHRCRRLKP